MVDNNNPANQFHPYQPVTDTPHTETTSRLGRLLKRAGIDLRRFSPNSRSVGNVDVRQSIEKARGYARSNPGVVLGGIAALVIGAGLMRKRRTS